MDATTSKQDMVSILLNLRNKKLCNEPIKARLKTSSTATTTRETYGQVSEISSYNTYRNSDVSQAGKIYSGDRVNYSFRDSSKPFSKARGAKGTEYHGFHKKGYSFEGRKVYKSDAKKSSPTSSSSSSSSPPPPLVDEHFPGLAGSARKEGVEESIKNGEKEMPKEMSNSITGYAAALLKAAPPVTEVSTKVIQKSSTEVRKTSEAKVRFVQFCLLIELCVSVWSDDTNICIAISEKLIAMCVHFLYSYCLTKWRRKYFNAENDLTQPSSNHMFSCGYSRKWKM